MLLKITSVPLNLKHIFDYVLNVIKFQFALSQLNGLGLKTVYEPGKEEDQTQQFTLHNYTVINLLQ